MTNTSKLTPGNIRSAGIPSELHARIKALSERDDLAMYEVIERAIDLYERWDTIAAVFAPLTKEPA